MPDDETREWLERLFPKRRPVEPKPDDPMRQFADELFSRAEDE